MPDGIPGLPDFGFSPSVPSAQISVSATRRILDLAERAGGQLQDKVKRHLSSALSSVAQGGATLELKAVTPINTVVGDAERLHQQISDSVHNDLAAKLAVHTVAAEQLGGSPGPGACTNRDTVHPQGSNFHNWCVIGGLPGQTMILSDPNQPGICGGVGANATGTVSDPDIARQCGCVQNSVDPNVWYYTLWPDETPPSVFSPTQIDDFLFVNDSNQVVGSLHESFGGDWTAGLEAVRRAHVDPNKCLPCIGQPPPPCPSWNAYSTTQTSNDCECVCSTDKPPAGKTYLRGTFASESECQSFVKACQNNPPTDGCCPSVVCPPTTVTCPSPPECQYVSVCDLSSWKDWFRELCKIYKSDCAGSGSSECKLEVLPAWSVEECASEWRDPIESWLDDAVPAIAADTTYHDRDDLLHQVLSSISLGEFVGKDPLAELGV